MKPLDRAWLAQQRDESVAMAHALRLRGDEDLANDDKPGAHAAAAFYAEAHAQERRARTAQIRLDAEAAVMIGRARNRRRHAAGAAR